jgi:hypothetical protein
MTSSSPLSVRSIIRAFRGGSSWPVLVDADGHRCVMKWSGSAEGPGANAADLIALRLARAVGIPVPNPRILHVTEAVADPRLDPELNDLVRRSLGLNLGIDEVADFEPYEPRHRDRVPAELQTTIYAFDLLLLNMDRIESNPNMVMTKTGVLCWDYAAAMEVRMLINRRPIDERRFYPLLRQHPFFAAGPLPALTWPVLDAPALRSVLEEVPASWLPADSELSGIAARLAEFFAEAQSTVLRRHAGVSEVATESPEERASRTDANRRAFEATVQRLSNPRRSSS